MPCCLFSLSLAREEGQVEWRSARYIHLNDGNFLDMFQTQEVVPFVSAFAMVGLHDDPVFDVVGGRVVGATPQFLLHELSLLVCAFAKVAAIDASWYVVRAGC
jgi:hypothetical protein